MCFCVCLFFLCLCVCRSNVLLPKLPQERSVGTKLSAFLVARCFWRERGRLGERERGREGGLIPGNSAILYPHVCKYVHTCTYIYM